MEVDTRGNNLEVVFQNLLVTIHMEEEALVVFPNHMVFQEVACRKISQVAILVPLFFLEVFPNIRGVLMVMVFHSLGVAHNNQEFCEYPQEVSEDI